jgi:hypothetical protein
MDQIINNIITEHNIDIPDFDNELMNLVNKLFEAFIKINLNTAIPDSEPKAKTQKVLKENRIEDPASVKSKDDLNNCTVGVLDEFCKKHELKVGGVKTERIDRVWRFLEGKSIDEDLKNNKTKKEKKNANEHKCEGVNVKGTACAIAGTQKARDCGTPQEASRLSNPPCTLRSTGWNRWEWLCYDPQERASVPFDYLVSNRIMVKDNHVPCLPNPSNQTNNLPATSADPLDTLSGWKPVPGTGAQPPGNAPNNQSYRSCEWAKAVNGY